MDLHTCYETLGGSYEDVAARLPSQRLIKKILLKFREDPSYRELEAAIKSQDQNAAFRAAHNLKGICLNMSFTTLLGSCSALTEVLRPGKEYDADTARQLFTTVTRDYIRVTSAISLLDD